MGMSASQARLLSITARMTDIEFKSQQISNTKIRLADESEQVAENYTKALNKQKLTKTVWDANTQQMTRVGLKPSNLSSYGMELRAKDGSNIDMAKMAKVTESEMYDMIQSGEFYLVSTTQKDENNNPKQVSVDGSNSLAIESDSSDLAKAEAEYNAKTAKINTKEKLLDNDLKALDTEHSALKTEMDSVKSLIKDNVDKTFNLFS